jgi:AraC-like DNA-binding protein
MPSDRLMRRLAQALFATRFNGPLRLISMEGVVIQLLAAQIAAAEQPSYARQRVLSLQERQAVSAARDRLLADMRRPPSLGELSALTGLSERRLNAGFRTLFGTTVFESLRNQRLEHARVAFKTTQLPLKEIAFRVGYNHVSNFINAFTARYGAPPRQYTQARRASTSRPLRQNPRPRSA